MYIECLQLLRAEEGRRRGVTPHELYLLADIKSNLENIYAYCETRSIYSDGERDRWRYVSSIAKAGIRKADEIEGGAE